MMVVPPQGAALKHGKVEAHCYHASLLKLGLVSTRSSAAWSRCAVVYLGLTVSLVTVQDLLLLSQTLQVCKELAVRH